MSNPIMNMLNMNNTMPNIPPQIMQLAQLMKNGGNMHAMLNMMASQYPELGILLQANGGATSQGIEQFCREMCQRKGMDFDSIYKQAQQMSKQLNI